MILHVQTDAYILLVANQMTVLASAHLLVSGVRRWLGKRSSPLPWTVAAGACAVWIGGAGAAGLSLAILSLPVLFYAGVAFISAGTRLISSRERTGTGVSVVGATLIAWGIHKLDYPFLRPVEWFAPWGYLLGALAAMIVGMGMVLVYFEHARDRLAEAVDERELLVREIHHRVRNNLGIIYALLQFQKADGNHQSIHAALESVQNRVASMSLIHEQLYTSSDIAHLLADRYLNALTSQITQTIVGNQERVTVETDIAPVPLSPEIAVPCGLIVNELVSNSLCFAFPDGAAGSVRVELAVNRDRCVLSVVDDGVGIADRSSGSSGLGHQIVERLADQLQGTIEIETDHGTTVRVSFPISTPTGENEEAR
jgi:two-component sensor histidine kinase